MNTAFHSSSFGSIAAASEDTMTPVRMRQPSRSTSSCDLRTAAAGSPAVSWDRNSTGRPGTPPCVLVTKLPRRADHAPLGIPHLLPQPARALRLAAEQRVAAGDNRGDA